MRQHLLDIVGGLIADGYDVEVISPANESLSLRLSDLGVRFTELAFSDRPSPADVRATWRLTKILKGSRPDILHVHGNKAQLIGVPAAYLARVPTTISTVHNFL